MLKTEHARAPFDLLECMDNGGLLPFGGIRGVPAIVRLHGATFFFDSKLGLNTSDPHTHKLEKMTLKNADYLVSVSDYIGAAEPLLAGLSRRSDRTIYNAVDASLFCPDSSVETETGLIVFANKIHPLKGVMALCKAMNIVGRAYPAAKLLMLGRDSTIGPSGRRVCEEAADELDAGMRDRVIFTGMKDRSEVLTYLRRAHVCCYPSKLESFGIAPMEAMSVGKPTIFSRTGAGPEIIEDRVTGLLCDPDSPEDIAEKICRILGNDELGAGLGKRARERVLKCFDRPGWISRNLDFFEEVMSGRKRDKEIPSSR
jgi:glycosyltransferase involved in cell wall biosynthesis